MTIKKMGVINLTPNSFSDGGETSLTNLQKKISEFGKVDAIDIGAESTAPMNASVSWETEWERLLPVLPVLRNFSGALSFDTYHPETVEEILKWYLNEGLTQKLIWNDVSGKFDSYVWDFLSLNPNFSYVFCHNLAPSRELSGRHMDYVDPNLSLEALKDYFYPRKHPQVIFDPCLGFSKSYEQNWSILNNLIVLKELVNHDHWLIGFSRKSFFRKFMNLDISEKEKLDRAHAEFVKKNIHFGVWIRTHRPELL